MRLWLLSLLLCMTSAWANIGSVVDLSGPATVKRGKETIALSKNSAIESNDRIETKNAKVKIVFKDNTTVSVSEHSNLVIDEFVYDPKNSSASKIALKAAAGTVRYASGSIAAANPKSVNISTPTATIAVRGTDFIMGVNEIGSSLVLLMPDCNGEMCGSGRIDVTSGATTVTLDRPFQATLVETMGMSPSPPIVVDLSGEGSNTSNLVSDPPRTSSGASAVSAARAAAGKFDSNKDNKSQNTQESQTAHKNQQTRQKEDSEDKQIIVSSASESPIEEIKENLNVKRIWKNELQTQQLGWLYQSASDDGKHYVRIILPKDTTTTVTVTQNSYSNSYQFSKSSQSRITIIQNNK